jgi:hypothetical protein
MKTIIIILLALSLSACSTPFFKTYIFDSEAFNAPENSAARFALAQSLMQQGSDIQWRNAYENQGNQPNINDAVLHHMILMNQLKH